MRVFHLIVIFVLISGGFSYAAVDTQEKIALTDNIIGSSFKALAKAFITASDIDKIKKSNSVKLKEMDEERFRKRYAKVYNIIKDYSFLTEPYVLNKGLTKQEAIEKINLLDKKKACQIIDSIPNALIASQFKLYLNGKKQEIQKSNFILQVQRLWDKITSRAGVK